ncbi:MAG TPA: hypothetical protein VME46_20410, partial [Acidimicrobiales bacterium]|nr:hypothetical protein [Acidimicrobiales bacterium]
LVIRARRATKGTRITDLTGIINRLEPVLDMVRVRFDLAPLAHTDHDLLIAGFASGPEVF